MVKRKKKLVPKGAIIGFTIMGSRVRGSRDVLFKTKRGAQGFTKDVGGKPRIAFRTARRRKPFLLPKGFKRK